MRSWDGEVQSEGEDIVADMKTAEQSAPEEPLDTQAAPEIQAEEKPVPEIQKRKQPQQRQSRVHLKRTL